MINPDFLSHPLVCQPARPVPSGFLTENSGGVVWRYRSLRMPRKCQYIDECAVERHVVVFLQRLLLIFIEPLNYWLNGIFLFLMRLCFHVRARKNNQCDFCAT